MAVPAVDTQAVVLLGSLVLWQVVYLVEERSKIIRNRTILDKRSSIAQEVLLV